jgi:hypothetical protein
MVQWSELRWAPLAWQTLEDYNAVGSLFKKQGGLQQDGQRLDLPSKTDSVFSL